MKSILSILLTFLTASVSFSERLPLDTDLRDSSLRIEIYKGVWNYNRIRSEPVLLLRESNGQLIDAFPALVGPISRIETKYRRFATPTPDDFFSVFNSVEYYDPPGEIPALENVVFINRLIGIFSLYDPEEFWKYVNRGYTMGGILLPSSAAEKLYQRLHWVDEESSERAPEDRVNWKRAKIFIARAHYSTLPDASAIEAKINRARYDEKFLKKWVKTDAMKNVIYGTKAEE